MLAIYLTCCRVLTAVNANKTKRFYSFIWSTDSSRARSHCIVLVCTGRTCTTAVRYALAHVTVVHYTYHIVSFSRCG